MSLRDEMDDTLRLDRTESDRFIAAGIRCKHFETFTADSRDNFIKSFSFTVGIWITTLPVTPSESQTAALEGSRSIARCAPAE
jgi:hypothetical protein